MPGGSSVGGGSMGSGRRTPELDDVLVFSRTTVFRHTSIAAGIAAIRAMGEAEGFSVEASEDPAFFTDERLDGYDVVVWLSTTGDVLDPDGQAAFERYIRSGGAWVGIHAAADTEYDWPWYGGLIGGDAWFSMHPPGTPTATLAVDADNFAHGSVEHLPERFSWTDEWYNFRVNPGSAVTVLLRLDESSYDPGEGAMGQDHPIAWYHEYDGGRAWYTGVGHRDAMFRDEMFLRHVLGGIRWAGAAEQR